MRVYDKFYINGQWVEPLSPKSLDVINPATEQVCARISIGSAADVDVAAKAARKAFETYSRSSRQQRIDVLAALIEQYQKRYNDMADAISEEMGAPTKLAVEAQAATGIGHLMTAMEILKTYEFEETAGASRVFKEPIGVCGLITPWNWPIGQSRLLAADE